MAEINKLDVGKALDKLRGAETPKARMTQLDDKIAALQEETQRARAMGYRVERGQRGASAAPEPQQPAKTRAGTSRAVWIAVAVVVAIAVLILASSLL
jgi:hypothetical protein